MKRSLGKTIAHAQAHNTKGGSGTHHQSLTHLQGMSCEPQACKPSDLSLVRQAPPAHACKQKRTLHERQRTPCCPTLARNVPKTHTYRPCVTWLWSGTSPARPALLSRSHSLRHCSARHTEARVGDACASVSRRRQMCAYTTRPRDCPTRRQRSGWPALRRSERVNRCVACTWAIRIACTARAVHPGHEHDLFTKGGTQPGRFYFWHTIGLHANAVCLYAASNRSDILMRRLAWTS